MGTKRSIVERLVQLILLFFVSGRSDGWVGPKKEEREYLRDIRTTFDIKTNAGVCFLDMCVNDPSAGSPTETLLRLLLPRNVQI